MKIVNQTPPEIQQVNRLFEQLAAKSDFSDLAGVYTKNARVLPPGADTVTGLTAIQDFWQSAAQALGLKSLTLKTMEFALTGESAVEIGQADLVTSHASPATMTVKYVVCWKKQDGAWRWDIDIWNAPAV